ncbi:MAG: hypothetical protein A3J53_02010 [Candidatus Harrisonbacteria bacterium RIFCSPHIGHO2_02_FULL_40_20]|nr:MAG: hypothetical protein A3J53_02010 [Candidatus Harrisonbacteria bacterium RIFCSPHIGHO2_02_FULL_40_20]
MWRVYILYSKKDKGFYVGCTNNLDQRIVTHNDGRVISTRYRRPLVVIRIEEFLDKTMAFQRERFLKSLWGVRFKKKILNQYLQNINSPHPH